MRAAIRLSAEGGHLDRQRPGCRGERISGTRSPDNKGRGWTWPVGCFEGRGRRLNARHRVGSFDACHTPAAQGSGNKRPLCKRSVTMAGYEKAPELTF